MIVNISAQLYNIYVENNRTFQEFGVWSNGTATVTGLGDPEPVRTLLVTQGVLPVLGVQPALGRWFSRSDDSPGTPETAILTYGYWKRSMGGDASAIGRTINLDSRPREVIGVMPKSFTFLKPTPDVILPQRFDPNQLLPTFASSGVARLKPGVTLADARIDMARMLAIWIDTYKLDRFRTVRLAPAPRPLKQDVVGDVGGILWVVMGAVGILLLISCANVANLFLVRIDARRQELATRAALGASWPRLARELMIESLTLSVIAGSLGTVLAYVGLQLLLALHPANLPRASEISIDSIVLAFALATSLLSGVLFGLIPILKFLRGRIAMSLSGSGRTVSQSREHDRSQGLLVIVQVTLALVLLVGSLLMVRTFQELRRVEPGFTQPEHVETVRISIPEALIPEPESCTRVQKALVDALTAIPGVRSAAFALGLPLESDIQANGPISVENNADIQFRRMNFASPGLFQTLGTPLIAGRDFSWTDVYTKAEVAIVSEREARETWGSVPAAVAKRIREANVGPWREVIGVVGNIREDGVSRNLVATVYFPARLHAQALGIPQFIPRSVTFAIRSDRTGTESFLKEIRSAVWSVNPNLAPDRVRTMAEIYSESMARTSFTLVMLAIAALFALALGVIGIYGVISYAVSQRTKEIGIRVALGAQSAELGRMFVRRALALSLIGVVIGLAVAAVVSRLMSPLLFGITTLDPITYVIVPVVLVAAAMLASYIPARRASRVDPVEVLRT